MQMTNEHLQGAHKLLTSLQCDDDVSGKTSTAASKLEIDEPAKIRRDYCGGSLVGCLF